MQAAHGFVAHHPWAAEAGAVINVEATGTSGPDVLFRESGGWPAELYMKHAPRPVATATVRDLVRFANLPVDTDFSVFRDPTLEHGNLPGVDLASMLDGYSYHTDRDVVSRIRAGSIQAYGENVMRATEAFAAKLEKIETDDWAEQTIPAWRQSIWVGVWDPWPVVRRPHLWWKVVRDAWCLEVMHRAFTKGLMQYGMMTAGKRA